MGFKPFFCLVLLSAPLTQAIPEGGVPIGSLHEVDLSELSPGLEGSIFIDDNGQPIYLTVTVDGAEYLVDISGPDKVAIVDPDGTSMVVDNNGLHFETGCAVRVDIAVKDLLKQLEDLRDKTQPPARRSVDLVPRAPQQSFAVQASVKDHPEPRRKLLLELRLPWRKQQIGQVHRRRQHLAVHLSSVLSAISLLGEAGLGAIVIRRFILSALLAAEISSGGLASPIVLGILGFLAVLDLVNRIRDAINTGDPDRVAKFLCNLAKPFLGEFPMPLTLSYSKTGDSKAIESLNDVPTSLISAAVTFTNPDSTCSQCENAGTCNGYSNCAAGGECYCGADAGGDAKCFLDASCASLTSCTTSLECGASQMCLVGSCCGAGVCIESSSCAVQRRGLLAPGRRDGDAPVLFASGWQ
ncbi:hypothetical protein B0T10DRAFT_578747 [Thelonectria olida]|uniref:Uncharacterized protein n=1 Tax=Thelonectria olida TaxID=1576542 RepID=A0A9P8WJ48_9HYPO|nr:hypothetical protein B0T10DRAFT_578747 [Thelonectria olida]